MPALARTQQSANMQSVENQIEVIVADAVENGIQSLTFMNVNMMAPNILNRRSNRISKYLEKIIIIIANSGYMKTKAIIHFKMDSQQSRLPRMLM